MEDEIQGRIMNQEGIHEVNSLLWKETPLQYTKGYPNVISK